MTVYNFKPNVKTKVCLFKISFSCKNAMVLLYEGQVPAAY